MENDLHMVSGMVRNRKRPFKAFARRSTTNAASCVWLSLRHETQEMARTCYHHTRSPALIKRSLPHQAERHRFAKFWCQEYSRTCPARQFTLASTTRISTWSTTATVWTIPKPSLYRAQGHASWSRQCALQMTPLAHPACRIHSIGAAPAQHARAFSHGMQPEALGGTYDTSSFPLTGEEDIVRNQLSSLRIRPRTQGPRASS